MIILRWQEIQCFAWLAGVPIFLYNWTPMKSPFYISALETLNGNHSKQRCKKLSIHRGNYSECHRFLCFCLVQYFHTTQHPVRCYPLHTSCLLFVFNKQPAYTVITWINQSHYTVITVKTREGQNVWTSLSISIPSSQYNWSHYSCL